MRHGSIWCGVGLLQSTIAVAAPYGPSLPFGRNGWQSICWESNCEDFGRGLALQADRRLLITAGAELQVVSPTTGVLDPSFRERPLGSALSLSSGIASTVAVQADGGVLVGIDQGNGSGRVVRLGIDGVLDAGFVAPAGAFVGLVVLPDDRFVAFRTGDAARDELWRFLRDGRPDPGFAFSGRSFAALAAGLRVRRLALDPFGRLLVVGSVARGAEAGLGGRQAAVLRLRVDGTPDAGFGEQGLALVPLGALGSEALDALPDPDGAMLVVGNALRESGGLGFASVARLDIDGRLDGRFGEGGVASPGDGACTAADFQAQSAERLDGGGVVIAAGGWTRLGGAPRSASGYTAGFALLGLDRSGAPDPDFGPCGAYRTAPDLPRVFYSQVVVSQGDVIAVARDPGSGYSVFDKSTDVYRITRSPSIVPGRLEYVGRGASSTELSPEFQRLGGSRGRVTVRYATVDATAQAGRDYVATTGELAWEDGDYGYRRFRIGLTATACSTDGATVSLRIQLSDATGGVTFDSPAIVSFAPPRCASAVAAPTPSATSGTGGGGAVTRGVLLQWLLGGALLLAAGLRRAPRRGSAQYLERGRQGQVGVLLDESRELAARGLDFAGASQALDVFEPELRVVAGEGGAGGDGG